MKWSLSIFGEREMTVRDCLSTHAQCFLGAVGSETDGGRSGERGYAEKAEG